jgi:LuxR family maltose regulon positive regulatory protein
MYISSMIGMILSTKLFIPSLGENMIPRPALIDRLNEGMHGKLTLISASAGFGKTSLLSQWIDCCGQRVAWLSLDEQDSDPSRFLSYLVAALQTVDSTIGAGWTGVLQSTQSPTVETIMIGLINEIAALPYKLFVILDDYHLIKSIQVNDALCFLLDHMPPLMHLVIATREDPPLPLPRLRAKGQLTEIRMADLRFNLTETADFLRAVMGLNLSLEEINTLDISTEGWIAGIQLAALSIQGQTDSGGLVDSFTGSHRFVMDYLLEEVLHRQPEHLQSFLLSTSILDRMCPSLCNAVLEEDGGQESLKYLEEINLFIVSLDNERCWYRYHHLFADLLKQRLARSKNTAELHIRASHWYENNNLYPEAFHHAAAAHDIPRVERLISDKAMPLHSQSMVVTILKWLDSLPITELNKRPSLWVRKASLSLVIGQTTDVEKNLRIAEAAMNANKSRDSDRNLVGTIAAARATHAIYQYRFQDIKVQAQRALEYLDKENVSFRTVATWALGVYYQFMGESEKAEETYAEVITFSQASGNVFLMSLAMLGQAQLQEMNNQLYKAAETYRRSLELFSNCPIPNAEEAHMGLAHILYEWNDLEGAEKHCLLGVDLARQYDGEVDRSIVCKLFLSRVILARGDVAGATAVLEQVRQAIVRLNSDRRSGELYAMQSMVHLKQDDLSSAAKMAKKSGDPSCQARIFLALKDPVSALAVLEPMGEHKRLEAMVLQALALHLHGEKDRAISMIQKVLNQAEHGGFFRLFIDEGPPMAALLTKASPMRTGKSYVCKVLEGFKQTPSRTLHT